MLVNRVSHTRAGGRIGGFQVFSIAGDYNGMIGCATATSANLKDAKQSSFRKATRAMRKVPLVDGSFPYDFIINRRGVNLIFRAYRNIKRLVANPKLSSLLDLAGYRMGMIKVFGRPSIIRLVKELLGALYSKRERIDIDWAEDISSAQYHLN